MNLNYLKDKHKYILLQLLQKYEKIFDGLGKYTDYNYTIELKEDEKPYLLKLFPILEIHKPKRS